ncbi:hypothetical protein [Pedobacter caeni]|uniref:Uncharacterized protein n=1 Tax=Pedobacter caeni TaxID=288992 RepID=A0A1M5NCN7_9SPHI|nr:hypothetical protein [Pedobacter caeni]SHG87278.1 hypothetical protein SAMN04488522_10887 [Pedobacter caeni]
MKQKHLLSIFLLSIVLLSACKKDKIREESIDYNALTEKRIIEVSEQEVIKAEDIPPLERLLEKVTQKDTKEKLTLLLADVKQVREILPGIVQLRTNPDIDFKGKYEEVQALIQKVSNQLPRKVRLQKDLEDARNSFNTEEVEFENTVSGSESYLDFLTRFLERSYQIKPIAGKPNRFLRADIEKVDSLESRPTTMNNIRKFKGLKYLAATILQGPADLNSLVHLETVDVACEQGLKIDQLHKLKHLVLNHTNEVEWDFGGKNTELETLKIGEALAGKITVLSLSGQKNLKSVVIGNTINLLRKLKRLVIAGNGNTTLTMPILDSDMEELKLSGISGTLSLVSNRADHPPVKIKNFELVNSPNIVSMSIGDLDLPKPIDFAQFKKLKNVFFKPVSINSKETDFNELLNLINLNQLESSLEQFSADFVRVSNGTLNLGKFSKLKTVVISTGAKAPLRKLILNRAISKMVDPGDGTCDDCGGIYLDGNIETIFVD